MKAEKTPGDRARDILAATKKIEAAVASAELELTTAESELANYTARWGEAEAAAALDGGPPDAAALKLVRRQRELIEAITVRRDALRSRLAAQRDELELLERPLVEEEGAIYQGYYASWLVQYRELSAALKACFQRGLALGQASGQTHLWPMLMRCLVEDPEVPQVNLLNLHQGFQDNPDAVKLFSAVASELAIFKAVRKAIELEREKNKSAALAGQG